MVMIKQLSRVSWLMNHYRQHVGVSCMTEPAEIFGNIFVLSDYRGNFTLTCQSECGTRFCRIKESFIMELNPSQSIMCRVADLSDKRCPD